MLIYAVLNLCGVEIHPSSSCLQSPYRDYGRICEVDAKWHRPYQDPSNQQPLLRPECQQVLLQSCDTVTTQKILPIHLFKNSTWHCPCQTEGILYHLCLPPFGGIGAQLDNVCRSALEDTGLSLGSSKSPPWISWTPMFSLRTGLLKRVAGYFVNMGISPCFQNFSKVFF